MAVKLWVYSLFFSSIFFISAHFLSYHIQGDYMKNRIILSILALTLTPVLILMFSVTENAAPVFSSDDGRELPILMYHSVLKDPSQSGKYVITPEKIEEDIIYLKQKGYSFITAKQLVQYVHSEGDLPEKPVLLTFDDGMYNNMEYILPILEKHNAYAVFSVVGSYTDEYSAQNIKNPAYSYLRWCDILNLTESGRVELANHSYAFHSMSNGRKGSAKMKNESELDYIKNFCLDTQKMQSEFFSNCNFYPFIYTYPFGSISRESSRVLRKMGFLVTFSCTEGINHIRKNKDCLFLLKRFNRDGRLSTYEFFSQIKI